MEGSAEGCAAGLGGAGPQHVRAQDLVEGSQAGGRREASRRGMAARAPCRPSCTPAACRRRRRERAAARRTQHTRRELLAALPLQLATRTLAILPTRIEYVVVPVRVDVSAADAVFASAEKQGTAQEASDQKIYEEDMKLSDIATARHTKGSEAEIQEKTRLVDTIASMTGSREHVSDERSMAQAESDQMIYEDDMKLNDAEKARRTTESEVKTQGKARLVDMLASMTASRLHVFDEKDAVEQYLKDLQHVCVDGDWTSADPKAARTKQIDALTDSDQGDGDYAGSADEASEGNGGAFCWQQQWPLLTVREVLQARCASARVLDSLTERILWVQSGAT